MNNSELWSRYQKYFYNNSDLGLMIDISRMNFDDSFFNGIKDNMDKAFKDMESLESGVIANKDENRMVGHYWLRNAALAPNQQLKDEINSTFNAIKKFSGEIHNGKILSQGNIPFKNILVIGIGGSALGPQFIANALGQPNNKMKPYFFDNTDPDGMDYVLGEIGDKLNVTLSLVISKSGGTIETRNGMLEAKAAYEKLGLNFSKHAVAVTGAGSKLYQTAKNDGWITILPMWDWVGGRTSVTSAVGLLPAALQGIDIDDLCKGASACDAATRSKTIMQNPAAILALMWYYATNKRGSKDMVILPYKDRLSLFTKYLQQLIMESLGKEKDVDGNIVNQGITVYGNKGTTDQHAYIQQLRDGVNNFFVTFIEVLTDRKDKSMDVDSGVTTGDYLSAFFLGTQKALYGNGRQSMTLTVKEISPFTIGVLIALYERATGFYATLININAYHQPGVEAGKKAAGTVITLQNKALVYLKANAGRPFNALEIAKAIEETDEVETIYKILMHIGTNPDRGIKITCGKTPAETKFSA
ncbi:MAG: glucose-6-phosphate isomerase [Nitrospirae bacterium]|nr:glucose-6-phosphate isomerase [Nitrospirota bacterium]